MSFTTLCCMCRWLLCSHGALQRCKWQGTSCRGPAGGVMQGATDTAVQRQKTRGGPQMAPFQASHAGSLHAPCGWSKAACPVGRQQLF